MWEILLVLGCRRDDPPDDSSATPPPPVTDWAHPNRDLAGTRAALDAQICAANIGSLAVAWTDPTADQAGISTNPLVLDGVVYYQTMASDVVALDLATGATSWERASGADTIGPDGVAVDGDRVFAAIDPVTFAALDRSTGDLDWSVELRSAPTEGIDIQPIVREGLVYVATVPMTPAGAHLPGTVGRLFALDPLSGAVRWSFDTVDDPEALWGHPEVNSGGGAWFPPSFSADRGYWGTANPGPFPGTGAYPNGASRPGANLYTNSLVALDPVTGALAWYDQVTPHDLFDFDFHLSPIVVDETLVIGGGKLGRIIGWDPTTGARRWETEVGRHENDDLTALAEGEVVTVFPGIYGAAETPMAYADGLVYVPVANLGTRYQSTGKQFPSPEEVLAATGELVAIDATTGDVAWSVDLPSGVYGGATVSCDLVLTATFDGTVLAFDRVTGAQVWTWSAGGGINGWLAVAGDTLLVPVGIPLGSAPPALVALRLQP